MDVGPRRLLVFGTSHRLKVSFGVILDQLYRTGLLQCEFEVHHAIMRLADDTRPSGADGDVDVVDGVHVHRVADSVGHASATRMLDEVRPDVVLLVGEIANFARAARALARSPARVVGWFPVNFERETNPYSWSRVLDCCDRVVAQAQFGRLQLQRHGGDVGLIGLGVNPEVLVPVSDRAALRAELGWAVDGFVFLYVGRNTPRKGAELAVEAFRIFLERGGGTHGECFLYLHTDVDRALLELVHSRA